MNKMMHNVNHILVCFPTVTTTQFHSDESLNYRAKSMFIVYCSLRFSHKRDDFLLSIHITETLCIRANTRAESTEYKIVDNFILYDIILIEFVRNALANRRTSNS